MKKRSSFILLICLLLFFSCNSDDDFSTDQSLKLDFSPDKINFDTVFSSIGSSTKQFKIYNYNNKSLRIESVELVNPAKSGFRMNIDGERGTKLTNVEILKKDSLYGFVEITVNPLDENNPVLIKDSIKFTFNGNVQYLRLEAVGQDVYIWKSEMVTRDSLITDKKPLLIFDSMVVKEGVTLTVDEGVKFFMKENASVRVHGSLNIHGSIESPVVFRGERFDNIEGDIPYDNVPGQWDGVYFYAESFGNKLDNVILKNASRGMTFYPSHTGYKKATLINTVVQNTSEYGIVSTNCDISASNSLFVNTKGAVLTLQGGKYDFQHCTVANYFRWLSRTEEALVISNKPENTIDAPLEQCDFINTIVYGSASNEIKLDETSGKSFNFGFVNCLIKSKNNNDSHYINTIWNEDPLFDDVRSNGTFSYNFELTQGSPAIDKADKTYSSVLPYDLKGDSRLKDTNPDIGCYEWIR